MAAREQPREKLFDDVVLANDDLGDLSAKGLVNLRQFGDGRDFIDRDWLGHARNLGHWEKVVGCADRVRG